MPRHDLDAVSLVAGALTAGLGLVALLAQGGVAPRWAVPVLLIIVGVAGLVTTGSRRQPGDPLGPVAEADR
ncbi:MAG: hypothetical protein ACR2HY_02275 [Acidimicrobiales bacterium]